ncbi:MAG TPA: hypothetical protein V6C90_16745 [Coleofasciculaceae cyanobacterium]
MIYSEIGLAIAYGTSAADRQSNFPLLCIKPTLRTLHCHNRFLRNFYHKLGTFYTQKRKISFAIAKRCCLAADRQSKIPKSPKIVV